MAAQHRLPLVGRVEKRRVVAAFAQNDAAVAYNVLHQFQALHLGHQQFLRERAPFVLQRGLLSLHFEVKFQSLH